MKKVCPYKFVGEEGSKKVLSLRKKGKICQRGNTSGTR